MSTDGARSSWYRCPTSAMLHQRQPRGDQCISGRVKPHQGRQQQATFYLVSAFFSAGVTTPQSARPGEGHGSLETAKLG